MQTADSLPLMIAPADETRTGEPWHVLVVDDDLELSMLYQELLGAHGYRVSTAGNGVQAIKRLAESRIDAILCDLDMPELAGDLFYLQTCRSLPSMTKRFIFVTGNAHDPLYESFLRNVKAPVLPKPVSVEDMLETLKLVLPAESPVEA
jgi:two-component system, cell cycle sensor histidine kinase and response regulator CckA